MEPGARQGHRPDPQAVLGLGDVAAQGAELGGERGEPVGLVPPDVGDPAQLRGRVRKQAERRDRGRQLADVVQVVVDAGQRAGAGDDQSLVGELGRSAHQGDDLAEHVPWLGGVRGPARDRHRSTGHQGRGHERCGVGQIRLHLYVDRVHVTGKHPPAVGVGVVHLDAVQPQLLDGHRDVRQGGHRPSDVADVDPLVVPGGRE